mgnify:FL=1
MIFKTEIWLFLRAILLRMQTKIPQWIGSGTDMCGWWGKRLQHFPQIGCRTFNAIVSGDNSRNILTRWGKGMDAKAPSAVFCLIGANGIGGTSIVWSPKNPLFPKRNMSTIWQRYAWMQSGIIALFCARGSTNSGCPYLTCRKSLIPIME